METPTEAPEAPAADLGEVEDDGLGPQTPPQAGDEEAPDELEAARQRREDAEATGGEQKAEADLDGAGDGTDGADEDGEDVDQLTLVAFRNLGVKVGGRKPDSSQLKVKGGKIELGKTQFDRGDRFPVVAILQVVGDTNRDKIEKPTGEVKSTGKVQEAENCGMQLLPDYLRMKLEDEPELLEKVMERLDLLPPAENEAA